MHQGKDASERSLRECRTDTFKSTLDTFDVAEKEVKSAITGEDFEYSNMRDSVETVLENYEGSEY